MWRRRCAWSAWSSRRTWGAGAAWSTTRGANLIADFLDPNAANFIENCNNITMPRHSLGADRNFDVRVRGVELEQPWQDLIILDVLPVETDRVARANAH